MFICPKVYYNPVVCINVTLEKCDILCLVLFSNIVELSVFAKYQMFNIVTLYGKIIIFYNCEITQISFKMYLDILATGLIVF